MGVLRVARADQGGETATNVVNSLRGLTNMSGDELNRAKAVAKGQLLRRLDCDATLMNNIGNQLLTSGTYVSAADFARQVDAVTVASATAAAKQLLASAPTVAAYGDIYAPPHYDAVRASLRA